MSTPSTSPSDPSPAGRRATHHIFLVFTLVIGLALMWLLADVLILIFGSIVLATALRGLAGLLERRLAVSPHVSVPVSVLAVLALMGGIAWFLGDALSKQLADLQQQLPQAWQQAGAWLGRYPLGQQLLELLDGLRKAGLSPAKLASAATLTLGALGSALLMLIVCIYLAADPGLYRAGLVRLIPPRQRVRADAALLASGEGVARWLVGQGLSMLFLGAATTIGLLLLQAPLALALGVITGLLCFVPFFGAIAAGLVSVLLAFIDGPQMALYVALLFLAIQQVEEYLLTPFIQRWAVALPPAMTLISAVVFGVLFGPLGVVFATPLMVVAMILVRKLYVEALLEHGAPAVEKDPASPV